MNLNNNIVIRDHELYGPIFVVGQEQIIQILLSCNLSETDMITFFDGDYIEREKNRDRDSIVY